MVCRHPTRGIIAPVSAHNAAVDPWDWFGRRTFHHSTFADRAALLRAKEERGMRISVCLPTRNEAGTVGDIVGCIRHDLVHAAPLVDEIVVVDSSSADGTAVAAARAGALVYQDSEILPGLEPLGGKGDALWKSLFVLECDLIAFVDADVREFHARFVTGLLGPLLLVPGVEYVKAFYERPIVNGDGVEPFGGGRVTELLARPLLNLLFPELAAVIQPLSGEYAGSRDLLASVPFISGYGVELGLLVDVVERRGLDALAQVDLDRRIHRNQTMPELSRMAFEVLQAGLLRLASLGRIEVHTDLHRTLHQFRNVGEGYRPERTSVEIGERPPAITRPEYRRRAPQAVQP
jgi:glucosyl-3-phosphoglycerate synthase